MSNTVYLLGAGASCNCVPVVQNFTDQLQQDFNNDAGISTVLKSNFSDEFNRFYPVLTKHRSLDTFARLLFLQGKADEYEAFKKFIDGYISARSLFRDDLRYSAFLADLGVRLENQIEFSSKISLFTWNYDFLLEKELLFANDAPNFKNILSRVTHFNGVASGLFQFGDESIKLLKEFKEQYNERFSSNAKLDSYTLLVNKIIKDAKEKQSHIRFAWERTDEELGQLRDEIAEKIRSASNVIIIGYTFPFYNRLVDEMILGAMSNRTNFVLQDRDFDSAETLITQLDLLNAERGRLPDLGERIKPYNNQKSFYVPFDLDLKKL